MIRWHHFMTRRHHGVMRCHDMSTRRDMMTCHDMMTIVVLTLTVPEIFLYLCGCVAHVRQGGGPRRSVHLCSRRSILPRKLHMNPAGLTYDPAPHRADHLLSRRFNSPRKLHLHPAGAVSDAAPVRPIIYSAVGLIGCERGIYILRGVLTMQPPRGRSSTPPSIKFAVKVPYTSRGAAS